MKEVTVQCVNTCVNDLMTYFNVDKLLEVKKSSVDFLLGEIGYRELVAVIGDSHFAHELYNIKARRVFNARKAVLALRRETNSQEKMTLQDLIDDINCVYSK